MLQNTDVPVEWIREQIIEHPGHLSSAWSRLIRMWEEHLAEIREQPPVEKKDDYIQMHKDMTAAQKFWRNE